MFLFFLSFCYCEFYYANSIGRIKTRDPSEIAIKEMIDFHPFLLLALNQKEEKEISQRKSPFLEVVDAKVIGINYAYSYNVTSFDVKIPFTLSGEFNIFAINTKTNSSSYSAEFSIHEKWGWLSLNQFPTLILGWVEVLFYIVLCLSAFINKMHHRDLSTLLNRIVVVSIIVQLVFAIAYSLLLTLINSLNNYDLELGVFILFELRCFVVLVLGQCLTSGISLVVDKLERCETILDLLSSLLLTVSLGVMIQLTGLYFSVTIIILCVYIVFYILYVYLFLKNTKTSISRLNAHLIKCAEKGINPATVPTFKKISMLSVFRNIAFCFFVAIMLASVVFMISTIPSSIGYMIICVAMVVLFAITMRTALLRNSLDAVYGDNPEDMYRFDEEEHCEEEMLEKLRAWQKDMMLPVIPKLASNNLRIGGA